MSLQHQLAEEDLERAQVELKELQELRLSIEEQRRREHREALDAASLSEIPSVLLGLP